MSIEPTPSPIGWERRILIADDDRELCRGAAELLDPLGIEVVRAGSGDEALDLFRSGMTLHLALLDVHMPDHGGLDLFAALRLEAPNLPCILWSAEASEAYEQVALRSGVSAFLRKPVHPDTLRGEVQRVLNDHWGSNN
jgi:CheY-like chemotaxis protein